jgi:hypothetical protein
MPSRCETQFKRRSLFVIRTRSHHASLSRRRDGPPFPRAWRPWTCCRGAPSRYSNKPFATSSIRCSAMRTVRGLLMRGHGARRRSELEHHSRPQTPAAGTLHRHAGNGPRGTLVTSCHPPMIPHKRSKRDRRRLRSVHEPHRVPSLPSASVPAPTQPEAGAIAVRLPVSKGGSRASTPFATPRNVWCPGTELNR